MTNPFADADAASGTPEFIGPVVVAPTAEQAGASAAQALAREIDAALQRGRRPLIGWPVGRTPEPVVRALIDSARSGLLDLSDVTIVLMDDYLHQEPGGALQLIDGELAHSCRGTAFRSLVDPVNGALPPAQRLDSGSVWSPDPQDPADYDVRIAAAGGIDAFLVALGASDGHIALNPPMSRADSRTRVVEIAASTRADNVQTFPSFSSIDDVPTHGVTVGLATITDARHVVVLAHGAEKAGVVARLRAATSFDPAWPMTAIVGHRCVSVFCDRASAGATSAGSAS